jgi:hypothetical protein
MNATQITRPTKPFAVMLHANADDPFSVEPVRRDLGLCRSILLYYAAENRGVPSEDCNALFYFDDKRGADWFAMEARRFAPSTVIAIGATP